MAGLQELGGSVLSIWEGAGIKSMPPAAEWTITGGILTGSPIFRSVVMLLIRPRWKIW